MDELTQCWVREMVRISRKAQQLTLWEAALVELTVMLEPTMNKIQSAVPLGDYDQFLINILRLLVLRDSDDDREIALSELAKVAQHGRCCAPN